MRLLEQDLIQLRGFHNVKTAEKTIGFQVRIRLKYYRGVWVSQLRAATVFVNDEKYEGDQIFWTINGQHIEQADLGNNADLHWSSIESATLTIRKEGGLIPDTYDLKVAYDLSASYLPPAIDIGYFDTKGERRMVLVC